MRNSATTRGSVPLLALCAALLAPAAAPAQVTAVFHRTRDLKSEVQGDLAVRPIAADTVQGYLGVKNGGKEEAEVSVTVKTSKDGTTVVGPVTVKVPAGATVPVTFPKPEKDAKPTWVPLEMPKPGLFVLLQDKGKAVEKAQAVTVVLPSQYIEQPDPKLSGKNLEVTVTSRPEFFGPRCPVQLVLSPDRMPGLDTANLTGTFQGGLSGASKSVPLNAEDLTFTGRPTGDALFHVNVDDYPRAFVFKMQPAAAGGGAATPIKLDDEERVVRLATPRFVRPGPTLPVRLEVDKLDQNGWVEVALNEPGTSNFPTDTDQLKRLMGPREEVIQLRTAGDGELRFKVEVHDWAPQVSIDGRTGRHKLRVRLLDQDGQALTFRTATQKDLTELVETIYIDSTPPTGVKFVDLPPRKVRDGKPLAVVAQGAEAQSEITEAKFFWGKPAAGKDGPMVPPETQPVSGVRDARTGTWSARLPVPEETKGTATVSVVLSNGVGLGTFATGTVVVAEPPGAPAAKPKTPPTPPTTGTIKVKVVEDGRAQKAVEVVLRDAAGAEKERAKKVNDKGEYVFEKLPPGEYMLTSVKTATMRAGLARVTVVAGKEAETTLDLKMQ